MRHRTDAHWHHSQRLGVFLTNFVCISTCVGQNDMLQEALMVAAEDAAGGFQLAAEDEVDESEAAERGYEGGGGGGEETYETYTQAVPATSTAGTGRRRVVIAKDGSAHTSR